MPDYRYTREQVEEWLPMLANITEAEEAALHALRKHGAPTSDPLRALAILTEELGELSEATLKATSCNEREHGGLSGEAHQQRVRDEAAQIAGYSLLILRALDRNHYNLVPGDQP